MELLYIKLGYVIDTTGRSVPACLRKALSGDQTKYVVVFGDGRRDEYFLDTVLTAALCDEGAFAVADLWDGSSDYSIPHSEIKALARKIMGSQLTDAGAFRIAATFVPHDPR